MAKNITTFNEKNTKSFLKRFNAAYAKFANELGLDATQAARAIIDPTVGSLTVAVKFNVRFTDKDGKVVGAPARKWNEFAETLGLKKSWLGRKVTSKGETLIIIGLDPRKQKPVMLVDSNGKRLVASADMITKYLDKADAARAAKADKEKQIKNLQKKAAKQTKQELKDVKRSSSKSATLAKGVKVDLGKEYSTKKGGSASLDKEKEGKTTMWVIRYSKDEGTPSKVYGTYGRAAGEGANERRRFAESQLRKLVAGVVGVKKSLPDNYEA